MLISDIYDGVFVLMTIDQNGTVSYYISYIHSKSFPHFRGPGIIKPNHIHSHFIAIFHTPAGALVIINRFAYIQLYILDPQVS